MEVAFHLGMTVAELKARITHTEFLEWIEFLKIRDRRVTKEDIYMATIAAETRRAWVSTPKKVQVADFILSDPKEQEEKKERMQRSKAAWGAALQLKLN